MGSTGRTPNVYGIPATLNWCVESIAQLKGQVFGIIQNGGTGSPQVNSDWDATTGVAEILNKPNLTIYELLSNKGALNGYASLVGGTVPSDQLPYTLLDYKGSWVVNSSPVLANGTGNVGDIYIVSTGGTALGETWVVGNMAIYNGTIWEKIGAVVTATVTSVSSADPTLATVANPTTDPVITIVSAPKLQAAVNINNVAFDGTDNILLNSTYNDQTGTTYTFALTDNQKIVTATNASPQTYTVPPNSGADSVAFPIGTRIDVIQLGDGKVTIAEGSDVIIKSYNNFKSIAAKYVGVTLLKIDTNTWVLIGNLIT